MIFKKRDLAREERIKLLSLNVINFFVNFANGTNCLVYVSQPKIGESTIQKFAEKVTGEKVVEVYHVPQEELQYYDIDERVWIDTPQKAKRLFEIIKD